MLRMSELGTSRDFIEPLHVSQSPMNNHRLFMLMPLNYLIVRSSHMSINRSTGDNTDAGWMGCKRVFGDRRLILQRKLTSID